MATTTQNETLLSLAEALNISSQTLGGSIQLLANRDHKYLKDLKINLLNALRYDNLSSKESYLLALSVAINEANNTLCQVFTALANAAGASEEEILETHACVSLMNTNNVFYRFRHFTKKEYYETAPAGIKMSIMLNPLLGKEFFELMSLGISALNGCEMCVNAHEGSVLKHGGTQARIYDAVRLVAIVKGFVTIG